MLSILIPTYNYSVVALVNKLHLQAITLGIVFEILVYDDCSTKPVVENEAINRLSHTTFRVLSENIGRSAIRNLLANDAKYEYLLFLDADAMPVYENFIERYIQAAKNHTEAQIICGGILYPPTRPSANQILRWMYGKSREAIPLRKRIKKPNLSFLTLHFFCKKELFLKVKFNDSVIKNRYGYEDVLFSYELKQKGIIPLHIENVAYHLLCDSNSNFLKKTNIALESLIELMEQKILPYEYIKITKKYLQLKKLGLEKIYFIFYKLLKKRLIKNFLGNSPNLFYFDLYRLGYFIEINNRNKKMV